MKALFLNGSPRKNFNTAQMLQKAMDGAREAEADTELINLFDYEFTGCRSCFACQMKSTEYGQCLFRDGAYDLIRGIKSSDGLVFAAPIYYFDVPSISEISFSLFLYISSASYFYNDFSIDGSLVLGSQCFLYILKIKDLSTDRNQLFLIQKREDLVYNLLGRIIREETGQIYAVRDILDGIKTIQRIHAAKDPCLADDAALLN